MKRRHKLLDDEYNKRVNDLKSAVESGQTNVEQQMNAFMTSVENGRNDMVNKVADFRKQLSEAGKNLQGDAKARLDSTRQELDRLVEQERNRVQGTLQSLKDQANKAQGGAKDQLSKMISNMESNLADLRKNIND